MESTDTRKLWLNSYHPLRYQRTAVITRNMTPREYCFRTRCPNPNILKNPEIRPRTSARPPLRFMTGIVYPGPATGGRRVPHPPQKVSARLHMFPHEGHILPTALPSSNAMACSMVHPQRGQKSIRSGIAFLHSPQISFIAPTSDASCTARGPAPRRSALRTVRRPSRL